ncbi:MAG: tetratricopeptide repeat protein [Rickettsiales bacterium]|nr:tetratricopeptide repeat protein [Rickettsiales bacterium]
MSDEVTNLINQAKDQARKEGLKNFFAQNAKILARLSFAVLLAVVIVLIFHSVQSSRQAKYSAIFHQALIYQQVGDEAKAKEELQKIYNTKSAPSGVRSLASLRLAAIHFNQGDVAEANKIYREVSECSSCDRYVRDLAGLLLVKSWMADESEVNKEDVVARVEKIENSNKVLKYYISEQRAFLEALKGNLDKSHQILEVIVKSADAPQSLKEKAKDGIQILISKGFEEKIAEAAEAEEEKSEEKK